MKREEILAFCSSNPEVLAYVLSLESQIKELTERLQALGARLNQNSRNSSRPPSTDFFITDFFIKEKLKRNLTPRVSAKIVVENLEVKKVIKGQLLK